MKQLLRSLSLAAGAAALVAASLAGTAPARAESNGGVRVMPLGDSITDGYNVPGGYRTGLWQKLVQGGRTVDFTGSLFNGPSSLGDHDHEGHSGWRIDQIDANITTWLRAQNPRTVLLHIGTNDMWNPDGAPSRLGTLLDHITATAPNAEVFVATIIPYNGRESQVRTFNAALPGVVQARANSGKHVHLVDMYSALTTGDLADGIHPNAGGYAKMSTVWYNALLSVPGSLSNGTTPTPTPTTPSPTPTTPSPTPTTPSPTPTTPSPTPTTPSPTTGGCAVSYKLVSNWGSGLQGEVTVTNTGSAAATGWTTRMTLGSGSSIANLWGGVPSASTGSISVRNAAYNGSVPAGGSTTFGFVLGGGAAPSVTGCSTS